MTSPNQTQTIYLSGANPIPTATLLVPGNGVPSLVYNNGPNSVWIGDSNAIIPNEWKVIPLSINTMVNVNGDNDLYGVVLPGLPATVYVLPGGINFFAPSQGIQAGNTIINKQGTFVYSGTPAFGNLISSMAASNGIDIFGNSYLTQTTAYGFNSGVGIYVAAQIGGAAGFGAGLNLYTATSMAGPWSLQATFSTDTSGTWSFNANNYRFLSSGSPSQLIVAADALIQQRQASTWQGYATSALTDNTPASISAAVYQNLTKIWPIPAHDANVLTAYRLTCGGSMGVGAALSILSLQLILSTVSINFPIGSAEFIANNTYGWRMQGEFMVFSGPLNSAQIVGSAEFSIGTGVANMATVAGSTQTAGGFAQQTVVPSIDMTTAKSMAFQAKWGSVITNQQIVCNYSILERIGP